MSKYIFNISEEGLGLVAKHQRVIKHGGEYDKYFPKPSNVDHFIGEKSTFDVVNEAKQIVKETLDQTNEISKVLYDPSLAKFCKNIWDFCYTHIQYKMDEKGKEQLREPARAWADRKKGIDCDCFAIFVASILTNAGVECDMRIVELNHKGYYQHIYIVVPKNKNTDLNPWTADGNYWVIDPVLDNNDMEPDNITYYKNFPMGSPTYRLAGVDDDNGILGCACPTIGEIGAAKAQPGKKVVVNTKTGVKSVVTVAPSGKASANKPVVKPAAMPVAKPAAKKAAPAPPKKVVAMPGGKKVVVQPVTKPVAAKSKAVVAPKKVAQPQAKKGVATKKVVTLPTGKKAVVQVVPKKVAVTAKAKQPIRPSAPNISVQQSTLNRIVATLKLQPTTKQKEEFLRKFTPQETLRVDSITAKAKAQGQGALTSEDKYLLNRVVFVLKPVGSDTAAIVAAASKPVATSVAKTTPAKPTITTSASSTSTSSYKSNSYASNSIPVSQSSIQETDMDNDTSSIPDSPGMQTSSYTDSGSQQPSDTPEPIKTGSKGLLIAGGIALVGLAALAFSGNGEKPKSKKAPLNGIEDELGEGDEPLAGVKRKKSKSSFRKKSVNNFKI